MIQSKQKINFVEYLIIALLWFSAYAKFQDESLNAFSLYVAIPLAVLASIYKWGISIKGNIYIGLLFLIYLWSLFTSFTGLDTSLSLSSMKTMMGAGLLSFIMYKASNNEKLIPFLYATFIILYLSAWLYAKDNILLMSDFYISSSRMNDEKLNANHMAYFTFYITIVVFLYGVILGKKIGGFFKILFWGLYPLTFWVSIFTASRQVLILQLPLLLILTFKRYFKDNKSPLKLVVILVLLCFAVSYFYDNVLDIFNNSMLAKRSEANAKDDIRFLLLQEAMKVGFNNFLFGVGPACTTLVLPSRLGSHCTYTELFACSGILAPILYITMLLKFVKKQIKLYIYTKDNVIFTFVVFGVFFVFDNFFYMFHYDIWLTSFFILVCSHSLKYEERRKISN